MGLIQQGRALQVALPVEGPLEEHLTCLLERVGNQGSGQERANAEGDPACLPSLLSLLDGKDVLRLMP